MYGIFIKGMRKPEYNCTYCDFCRGGADGLKCGIDTEENYVGNVKADQYEIPENCPLKEVEIDVEKGTAIFYGKYTP